MKRGKKKKIEVKGNTKKCRKRYKMQKKKQMEDQYKLKIK